MKRLAAFSFLAVLVFSLAAPSQDAAVPTTHPYYPLKSGAEWTYKVQGGPIKVKVIGTEKVTGGVNGFKLETSAASKVSATEIVAVTAEGVQRFNVNGLAPDAPILFLPTDLEKTKEWNITAKVSGQELKGTFKIDKESVTVPLGTYKDAIHVKGVDMAIGSAKTTIEYWFAKDIGIVKLKFSLGTQDATLELEAYTAGK